MLEIGDPQSKICNTCTALSAKRAVQVSKIKMGTEGLEPSCLSAHGPKPCAYASSATSPPRWIIPDEFLMHNLSCTKLTLLQPFASALSIVHAVPAPGGPGH